MLEILLPDRCFPQYTHYYTHYYCTTTALLLRYHCYYYYYHSYSYSYSYCSATATATATASTTATMTTTTTNAATTTIILRLRLLLLLLLLLLLRLRRLPMDWMHKIIGRPIACVGDYSKVVYLMLVTTTKRMTVILMRIRHKFNFCLLDTQSGIALFLDATPRSYRDIIEPKCAWGSPSGFDVHQRTSWLRKSVSTDMWIDLDIIAHPRFLHL